MKEFYISINQHFEGWVEAETRDEAVEIALDCFEDEQVNIFIEDEEEI